MSTTDTHSITTEFFTAGGTLRPDSPSYVKRSTDDELINSILSGEFCYVLTARQMGKSSLMVRTAQHLQSSGINTAIIDLTQIGTVSADQWYVGLITQLTKRLKLTTDPLGWWKEHSRLGNVQSFSNFLRDVILVEVQGSVVIFIDEIDTTLRLSFRDDFFAAIRATYNARAYDPEFKRLTFVLLGVASPTDLIMDRTRTPFNIGHEIALRKFSREDGNILEKGLEVVYSQQGKAILDRIFYWTNGHPYLTQKLCQTIAEKKIGENNDQKIDRLVEELFLSEGARRETNLQFVRENILNYPDRRRILDIYKKVHQGTFVSDNKQSPSQNQLKLSGLVIAENGRLNVHNQIYHRVFNIHWIKENTPTNWKTLSFILASVLGIILLFISGISLYDWWIETQANKAYASFYQTGSSKERVVYLAKILSLDGILDSTDYQYKAKELFFGLRPEDQIALFQSYDVNGADLIVVAKGVYTSLADVDGTDKTTPLLKAIKDSLDSVNNREDSKRLSAEIGLWLDGRRLVTDGKLLEALEKYNLAVALNPDNISALYERSQIFIKLSRYEEALVDLDLVLGVVKKSPAPTPTILPKTPTQSTIASQLTPSYQPSIIPGQPTSNGSVTPTNVGGSTTPIPTPTISSLVTPSPSSTPIAPITVIPGFYTTAGIIKATRDTLDNNPQLSLILAKAPSNLTLYPNLLVFGLRPVPTSPVVTLGIGTLQISTATSTPTRIPVTPTPTAIQDGMALVLVPSGEFVMGYNFVVHPVFTDRIDAIPEHKVYLDSFYIDKTEVTNGMYALCVRAGRCTPPSITSSNRYTNYYGSSQYNNYPVIYIRWNDANVYCQWAGRRLPTEAEWEKAARGTDGRAYPWGNAFPTSILLNFNFNIGDTTPVDDYSIGASPYGVLNMAGNVWEWVADWYNENYYASSPSRNPQGPSSGQVRSIRGGGYGNTVTAEVRTTYRGGVNPNNGNPATGFRCAK